MKFNVKMEKKIASAYKLASVALIGYGLGALMVGFYQGEKIKAAEEAAKAKSIKTIQYLMDMPLGGMFMDFDTHALWSKVGPQALAFMKVPDPETAQLISRWSQIAPSASANSTTSVPTNSTTTTTVGGKK